MRKVLQRSLLAGIVVIVVLTVAGCSSSKQENLGDLKRTQYCDRYREFDGKVATAKVKEQRRLLVRVTEAKGFPDSLKKDYTTVIKGYDKYLAGKDVLQDEKIYKDASTRMARHAIEHCDLLKSDDPSAQM